ncbi:Alpha/beta knot methyltransferase [Pelagophyceae sp. CCMP2097]|nr:Alpha/beta knot methyltransferase [Pelagophyceae sp. CCMP2097]|mmetsp:Transcript_20772/g.71389  ORF Transcript_20772/g.71389 Transcript_20772/m.71389 type:complete len:327 (+) Transcript_20772:101-1081(+)
MLRFLALSLSMCTRVRAFRARASGTRAAARTPPRRALLRFGAAAGADGVARITSEKNELIKLCKSLHQRKHRKSTGLVLVEGMRLVTDALRSGCAPHTVLIADEADVPEALLSAAAAANVTLVYAPAKLVNSACDTVSPQGAVGLVYRPAAVAPSAPSLVLALDGVSDPGNLGALIRTAAAAAVDAVVVVGTQSADAWSPKALRAAMGATFRVPLLECETWAEADALLRKEWRLSVRAADLGPQSAAYDAVSWQRSAVVVGGEIGLSAELLELLATSSDNSLSRVHIPMAGAVESLNAAVAGSAILLEARRQLRADAARFRADAAR